MRTFLRTAIAISALGALLLALAPGAASADWSGAVRLSADDGITDTALPQVATDAAGDGIAAWFQKDPTTAGRNAVGYATRAPDGVWTSRGLISGAGEEVIASAAGSEFPVVLAEAPTGQALIAWVTGTEHGLAATTRIGADGPFGPPVPITGGLVPCGGNVFALSTDDEVVGPSAAMGAAGNGWIAWNSHCGAYARSIQGGGFGTPLGAGFMAGDGGSIVGPALGVDPTSGVGVLAFREEHTSPVPVTERSLSFLGGGALGEPKQIAGNVREVGLTVGSAGEPVATWIASGDGVYVRDGEAGPVRVSPAGQDPAGAYPQVVSSPDGTLVVAWRDLEGDVWAAVRHAGVWGAPQQLSDPHAEDVHVAIAADDVAYVTWRREVSQIEGVEASVMDPGDPTRSPGDPWGFQPTAEVVVDPAEGTLPSLINSEVTGSALTVRPDGVATVALTWANSLPGHTNTHVVGVIESTAPVGILGGETPGGGGDGGSGGGIGGGSGGSTSGKPAPGRDTRPPALTVFNATRKFFATGTKLDKKVAARGDKTVIDNGLPKAGLQVGTVFKWTQDEAGKARLSIVYEGCAITGAKTAPGYKTCTDKEKGGKVVYRKTVAATRGANKLTYLGAAQKGLIPSGGVYKAKLVAVDAAGNASKPKTLSFNVDAPQGR